MANGILEKEIEICEVLFRTSEAFILILGEITPNIGLSSKKVVPEAC